MQPSAEEVRRRYIEIKDDTRRFGLWDKMDKFIEELSRRVESPKATEKSDAR